MKEIMLGTLKLTLIQRRVYATVSYLNGKKVKG